ncbi:MAG: ATP-binding cassette domain-containing protein [Chloroflexi bacterium]|nr:ATP-binding cassette domain-containing protein [Chloroflexota bacterium]MBU1751812.1 ATP-binding cassette domain-containing protein [Chloroflexota bacterium]MBU1877897.1 ATP-binding cassette domain-containing protein [Chloroflexota bacterium]
MLKVSDVSKTYGDQVVLDRVSFIVNDGERVGLIGPNGAGKTTLLRMIVGEEAPDTGSVTLDPPSLAVGYLSQALQFDPADTIDEVLTRALADWDAARQRMEALAARLADVTDDEAALARTMDAYAHAQAAFEAAGGYDVPHRAEAIKTGLGLADFPPDTPARILSGGQKTRLGLARLLLARPRLLLLDEPTNHLDIAALEWLEGFLDGYDGAVVVVTHDRAFLDRTVTRILEIDELTHKIREYPGDYAEYALAKARELEQWRTAYGRQQRQVAQLQAAIRGLEGYARSIEHGTIDFAIRARAKKIARRAVTQRARLVRLLESDDRLDKPPLVWRMNIPFVETPESGQDVVTLDGVGMAFPQGPGRGDRVLFQDATLTLHRGERVAVVGPNGEGKTTLLRIIAGELPPTAGRVRLGSRVQIGYYAQEQETLDPASNALAAIRATAPLDETEARAFLHRFLFSGDDVFTPIGRLSHGERARLVLARLVAARANLLLLDEPINHLDIPSRDNFEQALAGYTGTVLMVVHDRYVIDRFATRLWAVEGGLVRAYADRADWVRGRQEGVGR